MKAGELSQQESQNVAASCLKMHTENFSSEKVSPVGKSRNHQGPTGTKKAVRWGGNAFRDITAGGILQMENLVRFLLSSLLIAVHSQNGKHRVINIILESSTQQVITCYACGLATLCYSRIVSFGEKCMLLSCSEIE